MDARNLKWWGWGFEDRTIDLDSRPVLWRYLRETLRLPETSPSGVASFEDLDLPPSLLEPGDLAELGRLAGEGNATIDGLDRVLHAMGRGYKDLLRLRAGKVDNLPDAVLCPEDEDSVRRILEFAERRSYAIVPFGGGTSVVGGVEPTRGGFEVVLTLDLRRMRSVHEIDGTSNTASVDAGIRGPLLEEVLGAQGFTFPHFPQSWEFSTLGGWIATRSAGSFSNRYGSIDDLVSGVRLVAPARTLDLRALPRDAHGPSLKELVLGSEGTLGVITRATIRVHRRPAKRRFSARAFRSFDEGLGALRRMAQEDALPDMTYLSDEEETRFLAANAGLPSQGFAPGWAGLVQRASGYRGDFFAQRSLLLMGFEGTRDRVANLRRRASRLARPSRWMGSAPARRAYEERFALPYLRDALLDRRILVDTVETAAPWSKLPDLYEAARGALQNALWAGGDSGLVMCHVSHVYHDGASLYFTFLGRQRAGDEIGQWERIKEAVTRAFLDAGGALSHHHGIGADHAPFLGRVIGEDGLVVLRALKRELDPRGIMNPGKLVVGSG